EACFRSIHQTWGHCRLRIFSCQNRALLLQMVAAPALAVPVEVTEAPERCSARAAVSAATADAARARSPAPAPDESADFHRVAAWRCRGCRQRCPEPAPGWWCRAGVAQTAFSYWPRRSGHTQGR